jgi:hypothetical protein
MKSYLFNMALTIEFTENTFSLPFIFGKTYREVPSISSPISGDGMEVGKRWTYA